MIAPAQTPRLAENIAHFGRALRRAGVPVGPAQILAATQAVAVGGLSKRDFYAALQGCFLTGPDQRAVFAQCFRLFWRDPRYLEQMMSLLLPSVRGAVPPAAPASAERRAAEALTERPVLREAPTEDAIEISAARTASDQERLRQLDFEQMSADEAREARAILSRMALPVPPLLTRRFDPRPGARPDPRRALRQMARQGGALGQIPTRRRRIKAPDLVILCDISGSMAAYSRAVLALAHGLIGGKTGWGKVHAFTFGTQLTAMTRPLARRDLDDALAAAGQDARDWEGGTRIGACLEQFNRDWARRIMGSGAAVMLITDGLERADPMRLAAAAERLHLSARRVVWINPLLRYDRFMPRPRGVRALLPHVDALVPGHSIASLQGLATALSTARDPRHERLLAALRADD